MPKSPFIDCNWLMAEARSLCVLATSVFTPPTSVFTAGNVAGNGAHLLRGLLLSCLQALTVGLLAADDLLGARVHLLLRQPQGVAQFLRGHPEAGVGFAQFGGHLDVLLLGVGQRNFLAATDGR